LEVIGANEVSRLDIKVSNAAIIGGMPNQQSNQERVEQAYDSVIAHTEEVLQVMHSLENIPVASIRWDSVNEVDRTEILEDRYFSEFPVDVSRNQSFLICIRRAENGAIMM
jgi:hypothetical protein